MLLVIGSLFAVRANAQWVVSDPGNLAQGIINTVKQIAHSPNNDKELSGNGKDLSTG